MRFSILIGLVLGLAAGAPAAAGQSASPSVTTNEVEAAPPPAVMSRDADGKITIRATRITQPLKIDGRLDEEVYRQVGFVTGLVQMYPKTGEPETEHTEMWILYDDANLYVAFKCVDHNPAGVIGNEIRRDNGRINSSDNVAVSFDPFYDGRNGFQFTTSIAGGLRDGTVVDEAMQADWNGVYVSRASRTEYGWAAEYAIPFKTLRYPPGRQQRWHVQLRRVVRSNGKNEMDYITVLPPNLNFFGSNKFSLAATLVGLEVPPPGLNLEIKPYAIAPLTTDLTSSPKLRNDFAPKGGVDVKYGITKNLTADFTYNTDFAQVEIDEQQINLTRFNLSFPEKREFFLEGSGIYDFGLQTGPNTVNSPNAPVIFYSRRIGLSGSRVVPVIGGGRLSGQVGPWIVGAFNMETDADQTARAEQTNFTVARVRRNILKRSNVGGIFTRRSVSTVAPGENDVYGVDLNLAVRKYVWFTTYVARSSTKGLNGSDLAYRAFYHYNSDRYGLQLDRHVVEKNFNPEVGFMRRLNFRRSFAQGRFSPRTSNSRYVRQYTFLANGDIFTNTDNVLESRSILGSVRTDFHAGDAIVLEHSRLFERLTAPFPVATNVTIPVGSYDFYNTRLAYTSGQQRKIAGTTSFEVGHFYSGDKKTLGYSGRIDLSARLGAEPNISFNWINLPQGSFTSTLVGARMVYFFSPRAFATALVQYANSTTSVSTNLRFRWEYQPGSEIFVVYFEGRSTDHPSAVEALQNRGFVVKMNRLFRP